MTALLFPGRHLLHTAYQEQYLRSLLQIPLNDLTFAPGISPRATSPIDTIIFAITSANHQHSRYNPIPFHVRAIGVDRLGRTLEQSFHVRYQLFGIPHFAPTPRFLDYILKELVEQTEDELTLTPENCVVLTSTPSVQAMAHALGYAVLPAEAGEATPPATPHALLTELVAVGEEWASHRGLRTRLAPATYDLWLDFFDVPRRVFRLWRDPLLNDEGTLSGERNYSTYAQQMGHTAIIDLKYTDIASGIRPGRIADEGCADGALLVRAAQDFPDSDLIGIEITGELLARCLERQRAGEYGEAYVHFHQRNITEPIFRANSIDTTICNSTLHELWSYNAGAATIAAYLAEKYRQLQPGGRLLIRDVVGPEDGEQPVYLWLDDHDGAAWSPATAALPVTELSTLARFHRFAQDFLPQQHNATPAVAYALETFEGREYVVTTLRLATEFLTKKDYTENWAAEMHEEFAFWSFTDWKRALQMAGFNVLENPNQPQRSSHVYTNQWILEQRWQGRATLCTRRKGALHPLPYPPTTVILMAEKPAATPSG